MHIQAQGYFGMQIIVNVDQVPTEPSQVLALQNLASVYEHEIVSFHNRIHSDMTSKKIEVSITDTSLKKLGIHRKEYEWEKSRGLIRSDVPTVIHLLFKIVNPTSSIGVSNLKNEIEKETLARFGNDVKNIIDDISSNYTIIIEKGEHDEDYVPHLLRYILKVKTEPSIGLLK